MTLSTDGRSFVFGVFEADGNECEFLHSLHGSQKSADAALVKLREDPNIYGRPEFASVRMLEIGE